MTDEPTFPALRDYLDDGPREYPDAVLATALEEVHRTPQRRGFVFRTGLAVGRLSAPARIGLVAAASVVVVVFGTFLPGRISLPIGGWGPPAQSSPPFGCVDRQLSTSGTLDLTGAWRSEDGIYVVRHVDDSIWWVGFSGLDGPGVEFGRSWTTTFRGAIEPDRSIAGRSVDVGRGLGREIGDLRLEVRDVSDSVELHVVGGVGRLAKGERLLPCTPTAIGLAAGPPVTCEARDLPSTGGLTLSGSWMPEATDLRPVIDVVDEGGRVRWLEMSGLGLPASSEGRGRTAVFDGTMAGGRFSGSFATLPIAASLSGQLGQPDGVTRGDVTFNMSRTDRGLQVVDVTDGSLALWLPCTRR